ncbi:mucin-2 isoform X2 [Malaya genurostris]|nr:mucin-2 isoform X2 [Malaya genurostris]
MPPKDTPHVSSASTSINPRVSNASQGSSEIGASSSIGTDGLRQRFVTGEQNSNAAGSMPTLSNSVATADYIMEQHLAMQNWMQQTYMQYLNQYMNVIGQTNRQAPNSSSFTNLPTYALPQPNSQMNPSLPIPPVNTNPVLAQTIPNLAYYPYLSTVNSSPMPSASSIPAPITSSGIIPTSSTQPSAPPGTPSQTPGLSNGTSTAISPPSVAGPSTTDNSVPSTAQSTRDTDTVDGRAEVQPAAAAGGAPVAGADAAPAPARRFPNIVVEEQENRDWLDIFFSMCRVGILMTVVYLYSSPTRCLTVFFIGISLYLYQIGFFRNNNTERLERARQIVVQQINNAHGIRPEAIGRQRVLRRAEGAAPVAPNVNEVVNGQTPEVPAPSGEAKLSSDGIKSEQDTNATASSTAGATSVAENIEQAPVSMAQIGDSVQPNSVETHDQSDIIQEANRMNVNDVATFLRTLVLSFFTSIIPDTPAA